MRILNQSLFVALATLLLMLSNGCRLGAAPTTAAGPPATVKVIRVPERCIAPDVAVDRAGVVHMVYGWGTDAYYNQSKDNGQTFTAPIKLNGPEGVTTTMGERGPKIALGKDDSIHVVWADRWYPGGRGFCRRYTRSLDGGKTFAPPVVISNEQGDGLTVAADDKGNVLAFWHVVDDRKPTVKQATWLYMVRSTDNGATFGQKERLQIAGHDGLACSMCSMRAHATADGQVCLIFRSATDNVRDFYVLTSKATENNFTARRVNEDNWTIDYCPMVGPEMTLAPDGRALCAFMTSKKVYWAISDAKVRTFTQHVATPDNVTDEIYPMAIANRKSDVLFLWQIGPMSVEGTAVVKWARYTADGKTTGEQGTPGTSFSGTKATAFVGADDIFYIVTTAKAGG